MKLAKWHALREKTADLSLRERGILAATGVVLVLVVWLQFFFTPYEKRTQQMDQQMAQLSQDTVDYSGKIVELTAALQNNPNKPLREEQARLRNDMEALKKEIEGRLSNLIPPEKMADIMRRVLSDYKGLQLIGARNLPVEPLRINSSEAAADKSREQAVIFAHGFEMELSGGYFQTLEFLQRLEAMSGFYWRMLDYEVKTFPKAKITVQISTLSLEEDWIGV